MEIRLLRIREGRMVYNNWKEAKDRKTLNARIHFYNVFYHLSMYKRFPVKRKKHGR